MQSCLYFPLIAAEARETCVYKMRVRRRKKKKCAGIGSTRRDALNRGSENGLMPLFGSGSPIALILPCIITILLYSSQFFFPARSRKFRSRVFFYFYYRQRRYMLQVYNRMNRTISIAPRLEESKIIVYGKIQDHDARYFC